MRFERLNRWGDRSWDGDVAGVAVDSEDRVYVLRRGATPVTVLDPGGQVLHRWGAGEFVKPHLISIGPDDTVYVADTDDHRVRAFDVTGRQLYVLGGGSPSVTGYGEAALPDGEAALDAIAGGPPFNRPTKAAASPSGDVFVSDGYRNCRVHRFSRSGRLVASWGGAGAEAGQFVIPHSVTVDVAGRVVVCDRENDRIQRFTPDGELVDTWLDLQRPTDTAMDGDGNTYVTELARGPRDLRSWRLGRATTDLAARVSVLDPYGTPIARVDAGTPGFRAPHAVAVDSTGAVYVSEVPESFANSTGSVADARCCLRKFERR
jgi:sugar lactone lactonase YvrE